MTARINGEEWTRCNSGTMFHKWEDAVVRLSAARILSKETAASESHKQQMLQQILSSL